MSLISDIQRHVKANCATFNTATDSECLRDMTCVYFREGGGRCSWYENCVLPADESLTVRYWAALGNVDQNASYCESCRSPYTKRSNRQKYCDSCRELKQKEQRKKENHRYYLKRKASGQ